MAVTEPQPWASLIEIGVKTILTRPWPAPASLIGQPLAIHAGTKPSLLYDPATRGGWMNLHAAERRAVMRHVDGTEHPASLGAVAATCRLAACVPITDGGRTDEWYDPLLLVDHDGLMLYGPLLSNGRDVSDQLPYGDFTPGRWAWLLEDVKPTTERCPACWGSGNRDGVWFTTGPAWRDPDVRRCPICGAAGHCAPIPARGRPRIWEWAP